MSLLGRETRARLLLRAVLLVAPVLAVLCALPAVPPSPFFLGLVVLLAAGFAARPESPFGLVCLATVTVWWALRMSGAEVPLGVVPAALLLLTAHLAAVLLAYGPPGSPLGVPVLRRWALRGSGGRPSPYRSSSRWPGWSTASPSRPGSGWPACSARSWSAWSPPPPWPPVPTS